MKIIIEVRRPSLPDRWLAAPDPRQVGIEDLANAILDVVHLSRTGLPRDPEEPDADFIPTPLELASFLNEASERIELLTGPSAISGT